MPWALIFIINWVAKTSLFSASSCKNKTIQVTQWGGSGMCGVWGSLREDFHLLTWPFRLSQVPAPWDQSTFRPAPQTPWYWKLTSEHASVCIRHRYALMICRMNNLCPVTMYLSYMYACVRTWRTSSYCTCSCLYIQLTALLIQWSPSNRCKWADTFIAMIAHITLA